MCSMADNSSKLVSIFLSCNNNGVWCYQKMSLFFRRYKLKNLKVSASHDTFNLPAQLLSKIHTHTHTANGKILSIMEESMWWT